MNETTLVFTITNFTQKKKKVMFGLNCYNRQTVNYGTVLSSQIMPGCFLHMAADVAEMLSIKFNMGDHKCHLSLVGSIGLSNIAFGPCVDVITMIKSDWPNKKKRVSLPHMASQRPKNNLSPHCEKSIILAIVAKLNHTTPVNPAHAGVFEAKKVF